MRKNLSRNGWPVSRNVAHDLAAGSVQNPRTNRSRSYSPRSRERSSRTRERTRCSGDDACRRSCLHAAVKLRFVVRMHLVRLPRHCVGHILQSAAQLLFTGRIVGLSYQCVSKPAIVLAYQCVSKPTHFHWHRLGHIEKRMLRWSQRNGLGHIEKWFWCCAHQRTRTLRLSRPPIFWRELMYRSVRSLSLSFSCAAPGRSSPLSSPARKRLTASMCWFLGNDAIVRSSG